MNEWKTIAEGSEFLDSPRTLDESRVYTPQRRPTYPKLIIIDDQCADETGEVVRIRKDSLAIGRSEGDLVFPGEALMSSAHARVSLKKDRSNSWCWMLEDLGSRNGVFLKLPEFEIHPGNEFVIGGTKLLLHGSPTTTTTASAPSDSYEAFQVDSKFLKPNIALEVCNYSVTHGPKEIPVEDKGLRLGRLVSGRGCIEGDPFLEAHHASVRPSGSGAWKVVDKRSHNGVWLRIQSVQLLQSAVFLIGEQRFCFNPY